MAEASVKKVHAGEIIVREGSAERCLYKIVAGEVACYRGHGGPEEARIALLAAPQCFGEASLLTGAAYAYTAVAAGEGMLLQVPEEAFESFLRNDPATAAEMLRALAGKITLPPAELQFALLGHVREHAAKQLEAKPAPAAPAPAPAPRAAEARDYADIVHPEFAAFVYKKKMTCPHCKKPFEGTRVFQSKLVLAEPPGGPRYDLRTYYQGFQPEWYDVETCPHCYFSTLGAFFLEPKTLKKECYAEKLTALKGTLSLDFKAERSLEFVLAQHRLALVCAEGLEEGRELKARFSMHLSWLYEDAGDAEAERTALAEAIEAYRAVYRDCRMTPVQEQHACMVLAGLLFRAGEGKEAREWAFKARTNRGGKPVVAELAEGLIAEVREQMRNEQ